MTEVLAPDIYGAHWVAVAGGLSRGVAGREWGADAGVAGWGGLRNEI